MSRIQQLRRQRRRMLYVSVAILALCAAYATAMVLAAKYALANSQGCTVKVSYE